MYVLVTPASVTLEDPDNFNRFHVAVEGAVDDVGATLHRAGFGSMGENGALIAVAAIRAAAAGRVGEGWSGGFEAMLDYARAKGWLTGDGAAIQAHVEPAGAN